MPNIFKDKYIDKIEKDFFSDNLSEKDNFAIIEFDGVLTDEYAKVLKENLDVFSTKEGILLGFFNNGKHEYFIHASSVNNHNRKRITDWEDGIKKAFGVYQKGINASKTNRIRAIKLHWFATKIPSDCSCRFCRIYRAQLKKKS